MCFTILGGTVHRCTHACMAPRGKLLTYKSPIIWCQIRTSQACTYVSCTYVTDLGTG